ncbi:ABC transporter permease [Aeribacillus alveayuensis]|uniref:Spermidine/putrescine transport system permease protein n=1 Tax=Aeribacillus alveayuensis TaxID=279215 RepID=A0ABT9VS15_9BACI|nr:putative spermidine/putrescine transport system permease protein [Bacillus alveayuensis]
MKTMKLYHKIILTLLSIYLLVPLVATLLFSLAGKWDHTILPEYFTWQWYGELLTDQRFFQALQRSLFLIIMTVVLSIVVMLPTIFIVTVYFSRWERLLQAIAMLPYGIPPIVGAVGLLKLYSGGPFQLSGTPWILVGAYFVITLPFMYQGIRNSLRTVNAVELASAAELLGATKFQAFRKVIMPNIMPGILVSALLSIALMFSEFALANLLVGGRFETVQIYLYQKLNKSGHITSAIVITYYSIIFLLTWAILKLRNKPKLNMRRFNKEVKTVVKSESKNSLIKGEHI